MEWTQALRRYASRVPLSAGEEAEVISWAYSPHLSDNVLHRHTYFEVCTVGRWGSGTFSLNGRPHVLAPGDTFFARPGEEHRIQNTGARRMELFWIAFALAPASRKTPSNTPSPSLSPSLSRAFARSSVAVHAADKSTLAIWNALREEGQRRDVGHAVLKYLARALILSLLRGGSDEPIATAHLEPPAHDPNLMGVEDEHAVARLAVRYIHDNLNRRLPIEEVASHVHVSPRHLARLFRAFTRTSPADYIEAARIQRARHLLGHERLSLKQTAASVGYADVQHFSRAFSRRVGAAPGAFRDSHKGVTEVLAREGDIV
jgi:AraC family L-rhamnose operon transcriptional activator RhaR